MNRISILLSLLLPILSFSQNQKDPRVNGLIRQGNAAFQRGDTIQAILKYDEALALYPEEHRARFNKAYVLPKGEKLDEAQNLYQYIAETAESEEIQANAWYNLGNLAFQQQQFEKAVDLYKNALRIDPDDQDAKHNYYLAKNMQQQQEQNQQNDQKQDQDQDKKNQENQDSQGDQNQEQQNQEEQSEQQNEPGSDGDEDNQDQNQNRQEDQSQNPESEQEEERQIPVGQLSPEETQRLLEALENQEKDIQAKLLKKQPKKTGKKPEKDW
jgi:tetratricopeptide (TPR) repeat protein